MKNLNPAEIYVPETDSRIDPTDLFNETFKGLPLEGCRLERNFLTGKLEFVAPEGEAFKVEGDFHIHTESSDGAFSMNPPKQSESLRQKLLANNPLLCEEDDDHIFDWYNPPASFSGSRIRVAINELSYGEVWYPRDIKRLRTEEPRIEVVVVGPIDAEAGSSGVSYSWKDSNGRHRLDGYTLPYGHIYWEFEEAYGDLGPMTITRVAEILSIPTIKLPERQAIDDTVWAPRDPRPTIEFYSRVIEMAGGPGLSDEQLTYLMRERRLQGHPFGDDPLRDIVIIQEDEAGIPDLDTLAAQVEEDSKERLPESWEELFRMIDARDEDKWRKIRAERLKGVLAVITDQGSLSEIVAARASEDWLERELSRGFSPNF